MQKIAKECFFSDWLGLPVKFADKLKELRDAAGLTQAELADKAGIAQPTIAIYEKGEKHPGPKTLELIASALDFPAAKLAAILPATSRAHLALAKRTKTGPKLALPHYGDVPCGTPIDVTIPPEPESLDVFTPLVSQPDRFLLTAKGRSMTGRGIQEGDKLVIQKQPVAENGQLAVVVVNDKVTLKVLRTINRNVYLYAASNEDEHERIEYVEGRDRIQGIVVGLVRRFTV